MYLDTDTRYLNVSIDTDTRYFSCIVCIYSMLTVYTYCIAT